MDGAQRGERNEDRVASVYAWDERTAKVRRPGLRVLLVEEADAADSPARWLCLYGHQVQAASNAAAGVETGRQHQPDVVLLDLEMSGMDGCVVAARLKEHAVGKKPLVIALGGCGRETGDRCSAESGIDLYLTGRANPEKLEGLLRRFQSILEGAWSGY